MPLRVAMSRAITLLLIVYIVTAAFNLAAVILHQGMSALQQPGTFTNALLFNEAMELTKQAPSLTLSAAAALVGAVLFTVTAGIKYRIHRRNVRAKLEHDHAELLAWWAATKPGVSLQILKDRNREGSAKWVQDMLDREAPQRLERLRQIQEWFEEDDLLVSWTNYLIQKRRFTRTLLASTLIPTAAIIGARLLLLLRGSSGS